MKLTYVALTAGAIAMIGAISMGSMGAPGRKLPVSTALAEPTYVVADRMLEVETGQYIANTVIAVEDDSPNKL